MMIIMMMIGRKEGKFLPFTNNFFQGEGEKMKEKKEREREKGRGRRDGRKIFHE